MYFINNPHRVNEYGEQISIEKDIGDAFGSSGFYVEFFDGVIEVCFDTDLSVPETILLESAVEFHRNYTPSEIEKLNINWSDSYVDYKKARETLKIMVWTSGFNNLTDVEKKIASKWFVIPQNMRNLVHTMSEQVKNGKSFHNNSVEARTKRADAGVSAMYNYLSTFDAFQVVDDVVNTYGLMDKYINYGREGVTEDNLDGIFDYLHSRSGSMYENSGLLNKNITPVGITLQQLADTAMDIFKNGNYIP